MARKNSIPLYLTVAPELSGATSNKKDILFFVDGKKQSKLTFPHRPDRPVLFSDENNQKF